MSVYEHILTCFCAQINFPARPGNYNKANALGCVVVYDLNGQTNFRFVQELDNTWNIYDRNNMLVDANLTFYDIYVFIYDIAAN